VALGILIVILGIALIAASRALVEVERGWVDTEPPPNRHSPLSPLWRFRLVLVRVGGVFMILLGLLAVIPE
jgi:hypothetical protein